MDPQALLDGVDSPNTMQLDHEEVIVDPENEKDDTAIITPDSEVENVTRANDFEAIKDLVFPQLIEDPPVLDIGHHTWHIEDYRNTPRRDHGPVFNVGGYPWRILFFPYGNNVDHCSLYLEQGFKEGKIPDDFVACVQFGLVLWNPDAPEIFAHHTAHHRFTKDEGDWGFTRFVEVRKLWSQPHNESGRYLVEDDKCNITAYVKVVKDETGVLWHNFQNYDSKTETGYVGLKNQGATCYLNSLIQSLYFTNAFRKAIYSIPTQNEETLSNSAYTLQRLFYQLQTSNNAVSTSELTKSFGWETRHIFEQQDVQELSRKLMERMEEKMKGTEAENILPKLFCGKNRTFISCVNVEYVSARSEEYWDLQLNVSGLNTLEESFKDYVQVEMMEGENKYFAEEFKYQDARKGVIFESFPEVLHLQLKRFQYDVNQDLMVKVNNRFEFPESFDASPYLAEDADKSEPYIYKLHGVLVHSGDLNAGHYYAFIKPTKDGWFYKYDDDRVTKATWKEVLEDSVGGPLLHNGQVQQSKGLPLMRQNSAYMLVYIRETRLDDVLLPVTQEDTPPHLQKKLDDEAAIREARKKERDEQHLYVNVKVITEDSFKAHGGTDLTNFELNRETEPAAPLAYRWLRKSPVSELLQKVGEDTGVDPKRLRFWSMVNRQNKTTRPDTVVPDNLISVEDALQRLASTKSADLRLWAEVAEDVSADGEPIWPASPSLQNGATPRSDLIVIFLKYFDPDAQSLRGVGHIYISREKKVEELVPAILKKMDWPEKLENGDKTQLRLFEEIKPTMIEPMKAKQSLRAAELQDGDIVCFQRAIDGKSDSDRDVKSAHSDRIESAAQFYEFLVHRRIIRFYPHPKSANPEDLKVLDLVLSSKDSYDKVAAKVGEALYVDATHLRLWTINATNGGAKSPVKRVNQTLGTIMSPQYPNFNNNNQRADSLYYEILDISLTELDTKKVVKVIWLNGDVLKEELIDVLVPKTGTVEDLVQGLIKKTGIEQEPKGGPIRVYECHSNKVHKALVRSSSVTSISDYTTIVAERVPEEDLDAPTNEMINAFHYQGEPSKAHSIPFMFRIKEGEKFADTKARLEKRLGTKGKAFEKIKFSIVSRRSYNKPHYLEDEDMIWELARDTDDMLGLDHVDRARAIRNGPADLFLK